MDSYVLDSSAVSAVFRREPQHETVLELLHKAENDPTIKIFVPFLVPMEVEYTSWRRRSKETVDGWLAWMNTWPVQVVESNREWSRLAAQVKGRGRISFADAWVASLALLLDAELVHKDPEFDAVPNLKALRLPYDRATRSTN